MSRIGQAPITIPAEVTVSLAGHTVKVLGPKGELSLQINPLIKVKQTDQTLQVSRHNDAKFTRSLHGLTRSLIANMIEGVTTGFTKKLELVGTGYRVAKTGDNLTFNLGLSHPIDIAPLPGISFEVVGTNKVIITGFDKQLVGNTAASIRALKKPEPYKGKGIRYEGEIVRRKAGKAAKVGAAA